MAAGALAAACVIGAGGGPLASGNSRRTGTGGFPTSARPRYGGTLRIETPASIRTLEAAAEPGDALEANGRAAFLPLVFETLARVGPSGTLEPLLAESWRSDAQEKRWIVRLRSDVKFHDGTPLTAAHVAAVLRQSDPAWTIKETTGGVQIESEEGLPGLPWDLASPRRAIAVADSEGRPIGTGPFRLNRWDPGRRLFLAANDTYRSGRPFLDAVEIDMARPLRDELVDLELGRADLAMLLPQDVRRAAQHGLRVVSSRPQELLALVFDHRRPAGASEPLRMALAAAIDRNAICNVLLQRQAEPAPALLPSWLSGYASLFASSFDRAAARAAATSLAPAARVLSLDYPAADSLAQAVAERIAVDAKDAGLTVKVTASRSWPPHIPDLRLVRAPIDATAPERALAGLTRRLELNVEEVPRAGSPSDASYRFEDAILGRHLVVPVVHLPQIYGLAAHVETAGDMLVLPSGALNLADAWLRSEKQ